MAAASRDAAPAGSPGLGSEPHSAAAVTGWFPGAMREVLRLCSRGGLGASTSISGKAPRLVLRSILLAKNNNPSHRLPTAAPAPGPCPPAPASHEARLERKGMMQPWCREIAG